MNWSRLCEHGYELDVTKKRTHAGKRLRVPCIINTVYVPHFSAILVAIFRAMGYKEYTTIV